MSEAHDRTAAATPREEELPVRTSSHQTSWTPSVSAPPPGTAAPDTHALLEPEEKEKHIHRV